MNKSRLSDSSGPWSLKDATHRINVFGQHEGGGKKRREREEEGGKHRGYKRGSEEAGR